MTPSSPSESAISEGAVGRGVFKSRDWNKMKKREKGVPPRLFIDCKSSMAISVFILNHETDDNLAQIGDSMARQRGQNRNFYGWAELTVIDACKSGRKVCPTPQPQNQWHADIILPSTAKTNKEEREEHVLQLANMAFPRPRTGNIAP